MSTIIAIDPGPTESAWVVLTCGVPTDFGKETNATVIAWLRERSLHKDARKTPLVIERIASYGMPVGEEIFETVYWTGRFTEAYGDDMTMRITRKAVTRHLCGIGKAKDSNVRQALIDRYGGKRETKKGGILYKVSKDVWAALGVAVTAYDESMTISYV